MKGAKAVIAALGHDASSERVFEAFEMLDGLSPELVRTELAEWLGPAADPEALDDATRAAHGMPPRPLRLRAAAVTKDADVLDLGAIAEEQLLVAGKSWDGEERDAFERLDGEVEGSFAGTLEHVSLVDAESGAPAYDLIRYLGAHGVVFHTGTICIAAHLADGLVETTDARLRRALESALASAPAEARAEAEPKAQAKAAAEPEATAEPEAEPAKAPKRKAAAKASTKRTSAKAAAKAATKTTTKTTKRSSAEKVEKTEKAEKAPKKKAAAAKRPASKASAKPKRSAGKSARDPSSEDE
ncbi:MAG: hypothetical protein JST00_33900 [Deltaproteobacteria bacterium]|nr:hypothetical protein [Deltaproteobacteria bacterium]